MSKRFAVVNNGVVDNLVISDDALDMHGVWLDLTGMDPEPQIGWSYVDGVFVPPPVNA